ncbi:hypothetical protein ACFOSV_08430 [Algoriphagus namhaensis]|uniref:Outer membrane protein beta-barrel domain-containing protein n=1 Tax=Algoriphagus namhaensis TaxID=915353 RepID=A0ABV8ATX3_9BACT
MKRISIIFFLVFPLVSFAQERGIGLRLGEPFSVTYKDFISDYVSFEAMIGSAGVNSSSYYLRDFENNPPEANSFHQSNSAKKGLSINARMAYHEDFTDAFGITQGYLLVYGGAGAQFRSNRVTYLYTVQTVNTGAVPKQEDRTNVDFGPEVFAGLEYYFDDVPLNVFVEGGIFLELLDRVGHLKGQGGIGVRYIF